MTKLTGWVLAGGIMLALAAPAKAQFGISIGNPYRGNGVVIGNPGYFNGYGYNPYANTGTTYYSSGYQGYAPVTTYVRPNYGYSNYGYVAPYRTYGYGGYQPNYGYGGIRRWGGYRRW